MPTILIVDDELHIRQGLSNSINWAAYGIETIYTAESGTEALAILKEHRVDLVITDVRMSDMTGLEMIKRMKRLYEDLKYIVISGHAEFEFVKEALRLRVTEYLLKPVNISELTHLVQEIFDLQQVQTSAQTERGPTIVRKSGNQMVTRIIAYIQAHYQSPISLTVIGDEMERNPSYISFIFHKETGKKLLDYIDEVRIEHALRLMENSNLMLYEIADMVGFGDYRQFTRVFKKIVGSSPTEHHASAHASQGQSESAE